MNETDDSATAAALERSVGEWLGSKTTASVPEVALALLRTLGESERQVTPDELAVAFELLLWGMVEVRLFRWAALCPEGTTLRVAWYACATPAGLALVQGETVARARGESFPW